MAGGLRECAGTRAISHRVRRRPAAAKVFCERVCQPVERGLALGRAVRPPHIPTRPDGRTDQRTVRADGRRKTPSEDVAAEPEGAAVFRAEAKRWPGGTMTELRAAIM